MKVLVQLRETSQPVEHDDVLNTYTKGPFYCLYTEGNKSVKYPLSVIWRVIEDCGFHGADVFKCDR